MTLKGVRAYVLECVPLRPAQQPAPAQAGDAPDNLLSFRQSFTRNAQRQNSIGMVPVQAKSNILSVGQSDSLQHPQVNETSQRGLLLLEARTCQLIPADVELRQFQTLPKLGGDGACARFNNSATTRRRW